MEKENNNLLPNIYDYLNTYNKEKILPEDFEYVIEVISKETGLSKEISEEISKLFFQEIKINILNGYIVLLRKFGKIFISSPKLKKNSKRIFVKFEPSKYLINKINSND